MLGLFYLMMKPPLGWIVTLVSPFLLSFKDESVGSQALLSI